MQEAIFKRGTMRLVGETAAKYELTDLQYTLMTEKEKKRSVLQIRVALSSFIVNY